MGRCRGTVDTEGHLTEAHLRSDVRLIWGLMCLSETVRRPGGLLLRSPVTQITQFIPGTSQVERKYEDNTKEIISDQSYPWKVQYLWLHWRSFRSQISTRSWWPGARRGRHSTRPQCLRWSNAWEETLTREPESPGSRGSRLQVVRSYCLTDSYICAYEIKDKSKTDNEDVNQSAMWYVNYELCPEKLCSGHGM